MRVVTVTQTHLKSGIPIGRLGENQSTQVIFPLDNLINVFGDGTFSLVHQRRKDKFSYPCVVERIENNLIWTVQSFDVYWEGRGQCELILSQNGKIAYDAIYSTITGPSLIAQSSDPPEPIKPWFDKLIEAADRMDGQTYYSLKKKNDYCYNAEYGVIDYPGAFAYFKENQCNIEQMACSSVRKGLLYGRKFDWTYDECVEFVVHTPRVAGRYEVIGVSGAFKDLTKDFVESGATSRLYKWVPFQLQDGINEYGVVANMNIVPADYGINYITPAGEQEVEVSCLMLVRFLLDNFTSATEAVNYLRNHVAIYFTKYLQQVNYDIHYMVADRYNTYLIEFREGAAIITDMTEGSNSVLAGKPYMTNFYLNGVVFNEDGSVYTPTTQDSAHDAISTNLIQPHGMGLERYNLINERYASIEDENDMKSLMDELNYTRAYASSDIPSDPYWYTEFTGEELYVNSNIIDFSDIVEAAAEAFTERERDGKTWQSTHTCVYNLSKLTLSYQNQESNEWIEFGFAANIFNRHDQLQNRDLDNQHPINAITGLREELNSKQDEVEDIDEIRAGARLGNTAYQKPSGGIPKNDLAEGIIPDQLSDLSSDRNHRTVTDSQISNWNAKPDSWDGVKYKPFETLSDDFSVESGALHVVGGGGTSDHTQLTNRDAENQHPISSISGLQTALSEKQDKAPTITIDLSQIVSQEPLMIELTSEQYELYTDYSVAYVEFAIPVAGVDYLLGPYDTLHENRIFSSFSADGMMFSVGQVYDEDEKLLRVYRFIYPAYSDDTANEAILKRNYGNISKAEPNVDYATPAAVNAKYSKPSDGIPASDLAPGVIPPSGTKWFDWATVTYAQLAAEYAVNKNIGIIDNGNFARLFYYSSGNVFLFGHLFMDGTLWTGTEYEVDMSNNHRIYAGTGRLPHDGMSWGGWTATGTEENGDLDVGISVESLIDAVLSENLVPAIVYYNASFFSTPLMSFLFPSHIGTIVDGDNTYFGPIFTGSAVLNIDTMQMHNLILVADTVGGEWHLLVDKSLMDDRIDAKITAAIGSAIGGAY